MKLCITICGICVGWMIGMSSSPVISGVITSILTAVITVTSVLGGFYFNKSEEKITFDFIKKTNLSLIPVTILILTMTIGAALGIMTRTSNILGLTKKENPSIGIQNEIKLYTSYGLDTFYVVKKMFDSKYNGTQTVFVSNNVPYTKKNTNSKNDDFQNLKGVLFSQKITLTECEELCRKDTNDIIQALKLSDNPKIRSMDTIKNKEIIIKKIHQICGCQ